MLLHPTKMLAETCVTYLALGMYACLLFLKILSRLVQDRLQMATDIIQDPESVINYTELSTQTEGYSATDLKDLVARAIHQVAMRAVTELSSKVLLLTSVHSLLFVV